MKTRIMRKIAVLVTGSALALSLPVASSFAVGQPNGPNSGQGKACDNVGKSKGHGPKHIQPQSLSNGIGWKCGLKKTGLTAVS